MGKPMHTPGPWRAECPRVNWRVMAGDVFVMEGKDVRTAADATLIAAAPTLKDMLATALEYLESDGRRSVVAWREDCRKLLDTLPAEQPREGGGS